MDIIRASGHITKHNKAYLKTIAVVSPLYELLDTELNTTKPT